MRVPKNHPVQPLKPGQDVQSKATCGTCGLSWDDGVATALTPAPGGRCPFEAFHNAEEALRGWSQRQIREFTRNAVKEARGFWEVASEPMREGIIARAVLRVVMDNEGNGCDTSLDDIAKLARAMMKQAGLWT